MTIEHNTPFEVTEQQYKALMHKCSGIVAGRKAEGKFYCKVLLSIYIKYVREVFAQNP